MKGAGFFELFGDQESAGSVHIAPPIGNFYGRESFTEGAQSDGAEDAEVHARDTELRGDHQLAEAIDIADATILEDWKQQGEIDLLRDDFGLCKHAGLDRRRQQSGYQRMISGSPPRGMGR